MIEEIEIEGFRSVRSVRMRLGAVSLVVGENGTGKTNLYRALQLFQAAAAGTLARAIAQDGGMESVFWAGAAYRSAPKDSSDLFCATYALHDNALPSGASTLTEAQVALAAITGRQFHFDQAGKYLRKLRQEMLRNPFGYGHLLLAADNWLDGAAEVTLVGSDAQVQPFLEALNSSFAPTLVVSYRDPSTPAPAIIAEATQGRDGVNGKAAAYLCRNFSCQPPITDGAALKAAVSGL